MLEIRLVEAECSQAVCGSLIWLSRIAGLPAECGVLCGGTCGAFLVRRFGIELIRFRLDMFSQVAA